ncbi:hypothetical protein C3E97_005840 [Pseudomonas sp. MWU12-2115]|nr:hypothetical protein C3E97_005840 [Pseudomonas sp. MWU12-2115]
MLANRPGQTTSLLNDTPHSRASPLPQGSAVNVESQAQKSPTQWSGFFFPRKAVLIWHGLCRNRLRGYRSRSCRRFR